jgi:TolB-like protein
MKKQILFSFLFLLLAGCGTTGPTYEDAANSKMIQANYAAADQLLTSLSGPLDKSLPLIVATLVSIDALTESSRLGRMVSEQIGSRLSKQGYRVIELKLRGDIFVKQREGELLLSREIKDITLSHKAQAVVVGTYSEAKDYVYLNLKIVSAQNNLVIAAHDYVLPIDSNVRSLLTPASRASVSR